MRGNKNGAAAIAVAGAFGFGPDGTKKPGVSDVAVCMCRGGFPATQKQTHRTQEEDHKEQLTIGVSGKVDVGIRIFGVGVGTSIPFKKEHKIDMGTSKFEFETVSATDNLAEILVLVGSWRASRTLHALSS